MKVEKIEDLSTFELLMTLPMDYHLFKQIIEYLYKNNKEHMDTIFKQIVKHQGRFLNIILLIREDARLEMLRIIIEAHNKYDD